MEGRHRSRDSYMPTLPSGHAEVLSVSRTVQLYLPIKQNDPGRHYQVAFLHPSSRRQQPKSKLFSFRDEPGTSTSDASE